MPRQAKGARLHWLARKDGPSVWQIKDGATRISTRTANREQAEKIFADYLERKGLQSGPARAEGMSVSRCLSIYGEEHGMTVADPARIGYAIDALESFWGDLMVADVKGPTCRRYAAERGVSAGTVRRELGVLQAAINHCVKEGYLTEARLVTKPASNPPRERWLTRQEAAWLLRAARSLNRDGRHLADFILCSLVTGSRKDTVLRLRLGEPWAGGGYVDLAGGVLYRKPPQKRETSKRQRPARLPAWYLTHLRTAHANGKSFVVETNKGALVSDIKKGWSRAVPLAEEMAARQEIEISLRMPTGARIVPHVLKHTAVTWALQRGATIWDAASYFSTSAETIEKTYGHHSPDHQRSAVEAMGRK